MPTIRTMHQVLSTSVLMGVDFVPLAAQVVANASPAGAEPAPSENRTAALAALSAAYERDVAAHANAYPFQNAVFGEGDPNAAIMFIGEAPGADEDRTGRPFVGRAGEKLDGMIRAMKWTREQVYIANIVKIRPPENRTPMPDEIARDAPYLVEQLRIIQPQVIVTLGAPASKYILETQVGITRLRGQWGSWNDVDGDLSIPVMPTFHPAYLLRNYTRETREQVWHDLQAVMQRAVASSPFPKS